MFLRIIDKEYRKPNDPRSSKFGSFPWFFRRTRPEVESQASNLRRLYHVEILHDVNKFGRHTPVKGKSHPSSDPSR